MGTARRARAEIIVLLRARRVSLFTFANVATCSTEHVRSISASRAHGATTEETRKVCVAQRMEAWRQRVVRAHLSDS